MTEEEIKEFFKHKKSDNLFVSLIKFDFWERERAKMELCENINKELMKEE